LDTPNNLAKLMGYDTNVRKNIPNFKGETEMREGEKREM
jgi:hypothetical protein